MELTAAKSGVGVGVGDHHQHIVMRIESGENGSSSPRTPANEGQIVGFGHGHRDQYGQILTDPLSGD